MRLQTFRGTSSTEVIMDIIPDMFGCGRVSRKCIRSVRLGHAGEFRVEFSNK
jgi:hypothetical protein